VASGGYYAGYTLYVKNNILTYNYNYMDENYYTIKANKPLKPGKHLVKAVHERVEGNTGRLTLFIDDAKVGQGAVGKVVFGRFSSPKRSISAPTTAAPWTDTPTLRHSSSTASWKKWTFNCSR
jgi:hypothetical protein